MAYVVLARKYRPRSFAQMVGQEHVVQALSNALTQGRLHHAYLFTGTRGIGKTTVSRILAKSLNCTGADGQGGVTAEPCGVCQACTEIDADRFIDYIELDAASNRGIDEVRDMIERAAYKPGIGRYKVFMIDEAHQLTKEAFNALLKTLEEPPEYLKFVLATTDPEKMLPTVLSRCLQFNLRPMAPATVREHLRKVLTTENLGFDEGALALLGRAARGSMRDGLSLTDQAIAYGGGQLTQDVVRTMLGSVDRGHTRALVQALAGNDAPTVLSVVDGLRSRGLSAAATLDEMALMLQDMAIEQAVPGALDEQDPDTAHAREAAPWLASDETQLLYSMALQGRQELGLVSDEYAGLTMVLLRFLAFAPMKGAPMKGANPLGAGPASVSAAAANAALVREVRALPLRAPAPPAAQRAATAPPAAPVAAYPSPVVAPPDNTPAITPTAAPTVVDTRRPEPDAALGDRWNDCVKALSDQGSVAALVKELAMQAGLSRIDSSVRPARWHLLVSREPLRNPVLADKLSAALATLLGDAVELVLEPGEPLDSPAQRDAAERQRRQLAAEASIQQDPVVRDLLSRFEGARIVPGSIRPL